MNSQVTGFVDRYIYQDSKSNFCILLVINSDTQDELVVTSNIIEVELEREYLFEGEYVEHQKYGRQLKAYNATLVLPKHKDMVINFLSGPDFIGIGEKLATRICEAYEGEDIIDNILSNPEELTDIKGVTPTKAKLLIETIKKHQAENGLFEYIKQFNVDYNDVIKVFNKAGLDVPHFIDIINKNPYLLMEKHISFKEIDKFATLLENDNQQLIRVSGFIYEYLKNTTFKMGATYLYLSDIYEYMAKLDNTLISNAIEYLREILFIVVEDDKVFERVHYDSEVFITDFIKEYATKEEQTNIDNLIQVYEDKHGITFNDQQKTALYNGVNFPISIITGGPGTGKSTIVDALINIIKQLDSRMLIGLCAPTGKASKRLSELTNTNSMTIHKMLKFDLHSYSFGHDIFNPLDYDVLIVDESSMIDNILMASLLKACFNVKKIIFLGDYNQLPSVSQGQILKDLIESNSLKVTSLNQIYRQKEGSMIVDLAYKVLNNKPITLSDFDNKEVTFIEVSDRTNVNKIIDYYLEYENKNKIQLLAPIYRGNYGIDYLNSLIQEKIFVKDYDKFNIDDRVIQLKNRNDDEIYNGDTGVVLATKPNLIVDFDSKAISYKKIELIELKLAYCISIHKSQGNEYDDVIIFLGENNLSFIDQKILYTAITRAKKRLIIISSLNCINHASNNIIYGQRQTGLKKRLQG